MTLVGDWFDDAMPAGTGLGALPAMALIAMTGSLANLLWRQSGGRALSSVRQFLALGFAKTPVIVGLCTVAP